MPADGLFAGATWRTAAEPFGLDRRQADQLTKLGRVLLQFYRALNVLYRKSVEGKQPAWVAAWLDQGKPPELIHWQRSPGFKNEVPRVIRPDLLMTENGFRVTELDSVPGGIGLTAWLNQVYHEAGFQVMGGAAGMIDGFKSIFGNAPNVHLVVSEEASTYRPEMRWLASTADTSRFHVCDGTVTDVQPGDAVYRFFELFDLPNVPSANALLTMAERKSILLTPPPKTFLEEKMCFALLWNRNLEDFWRQDLGESFFQQMRQLAPQTWIVNPEPLPPQAAYPGLDLTDWRQLKTLSQKKRELILKISGFSPEAWGARGVYLGSDLSQDDWAAAVDKALLSYEHSPYILQPFEKTILSQIVCWDDQDQGVTTLHGRTRLCPYYFVSGEGDAARAALGGVLATVCPADKKILHGMRDAVLAPLRNHGRRSRIKATTMSISQSPSAR